MIKKGAAITVIGIVIILLIVGTLHLSGYFAGNTIDSYHDGQPSASKPPGMAEQRSAVNETALPEPNMSGTPDTSTSEPDVQGTIISGTSDASTSEPDVQDSNTPGTSDASTSKPDVQGSNTPGTPDTSTSEPDVQGTIMPGTSDASSSQPERQGSTMPETSDTSTQENPNDLSQVPNELSIIPHDLSLGEIQNDDVAAMNAWLEMKIEEHKDEIDEEDLKDFKAIVAKLDQPFIKEMSVDGFDGEEQEELKMHLRERLTNDEYDRGKELFFKYNYLLDELDE